METQANILQSSIPDKSRREIKEKRRRIIRALVLVNWKINYLEHDDPNIQPPDKVVREKPYWFFRHCADKINVDVIDHSNFIKPIHFLELKLLKTYITQGIRALLKMNQYDLILSHGAQSALFLAIIRSILGIKNPPHILIDIGCFNGGRNNPFELTFIKLASKSLSGIIYHSKIQRQYYEKHLPSIKTRFIPFGVDTGLFVPAGNDTKDDYILSVGYSKRDYKTLIAAWSSLQNINKTRLKIVGVDKIAGLNRLPENIELIKRQSIHELKNTIARALFVVVPMPYFRYSYGQMTVLQSMAMKKAVIVTETPSMTDYIVDGENGIFVKPYDPDSLREKLTLLINDPLLASEIGERAFQSIKKDFNEANLSASIQEFISEIMP